MINKVKRRSARHQKIRKKITGTDKSPRLSIFRSNKHIYVQLIDDVNNATLTALSDTDVSKSEKNKIEIAKKVGNELAKTAKTKKINKIVFDRSGYKYHGRVKALADGLKEGGLNF